MESASAQHVVDGAVLARHGGERQRLAIVQPMRSKALRMQVSMPSASTSTFNRPRAAMSSLSHSMKVRSVHRRVADGHDLDQRPARQHEAADVLRQVAREAHQLAAPAPARVASSGSLGIEPRRAHVLLRQLAAARRSPHHAGERRDRVLRQPHGLADVAHRRARAIADDGGSEAGAVAAVAGVDVLDHLLAPLVLEVDVDVGRLLALGRDEALEQHVDLGRGRPR